MKQQPSTMNKNKYIYHDKNVLEASIDRINYIIDNFDDAWYAFSGGKDSLVVIELAKRIYKERGLGKPKVFFTDEELIPDDVIDLVKKQAESGDYEFRYFAPTMTNRKFLMGKQENFISFDPDREWVRQPPDYAITMQDTRDMDQWQINKAYFPEYIDSGKKVALVLGIRAEESLMRLSSVSMKTEDLPNWIGRPPSKSFLLHNTKPIYDWSEIDIFKYFYDNDIPYAKIYDYQVWSKVPLRVSTPLHEMSSAQLPKLKAMYPVFYSQLVKCFPDVEAHCRYWHDYDKVNPMKKYPHTFDGIRKFVNDRYGDDETTAGRVIAYIDTCEKNRKIQKEKGLNDEFCNGYPVMWVFKQVLRGSWGKGGATPIKRGEFRYEFKEYEYEYKD